jgi:hypothetical protein
MTTPVRVFSGKRRARFVPPVVILLVVIVVLLAALHTSINESAYLRSSGQASSWTGPNDQFQCLRAHFQHEVPRGASVWVGNDPQWEANTQMLAQMATLWAVPAPRSTAAWAASITTGSECNGLSLHITHL